MLTIYHGGHYLFLDYECEAKVPYLPSATFSKYVGRLEVSVDDIVLDQLSVAVAEVPHDFRRFFLDN